MFGTLVYLTGCTIKNRVKRRLQRLREPRYLAGLIVGLLYLWLVFFRNAGNRRAAGAAVRGAAPIAAIAGPVQFVGSLLLLATAAAAWLWPGVGHAITFSRAEVQFLFTAPVTRRQLVHYEVLRSQLGIVFGSAVATLFLRGGAPGRGWTLLIGLWILLLVVRLHLMGVRLRRASLAQHGASGLARQWLPLAVLVAALGALAAAVIGDWGRLTSMAGAGDVFRELQRLGSTGAAGTVLWPFRALARLPLAASTAEFGRALPVPLLLLALNYAWVLRSDAAFEEASAAHAEKRAAYRGAPRAAVKGAAPTPFTLAADGPPETAILWKNLILIGRFASLRTLVRLLPIVIVFGIIASTGGGSGVAATAAVICLPLAAFAILMGSQMARNDLRQDLGNLALLKTWPVRGAELIRGEVLAPTAVVTAATWILLLASAALGGGLRAGGAGSSLFMAHRLSYLAAVAILAPSLVLSQTIVQNALAVLFPAWVSASGPRSRGIEAMGQRLLMMAVLFLTLVVSVIPGALAAAVVAGVVYWLTGTVPVVLPALVAAAVIVGECWLVAEALGRVLERTDVSAVEAPE